MWPKRESELIAGGSLYWVIKGEIQARQRIFGLERVVSADGVTRCAINFYPDVVFTSQVVRRPFQGWRYLHPTEAPPDLPERGKKSDALPRELERVLSDMGVR